VKKEQASIQNQPKEEVKNDDTVGFQMLAPD